MSELPASQQILDRDGTSQRDRLLAALDPDYVAVDERSLQDLLAFAREYARELQFLDVEDGLVQSIGDWSKFLSSDLDLDELVAFMQTPEKFSPEQVSAYTRPHFALFLTFLHLLRHAQNGLNTLTHRHLDFYYQQVLHMTKKPGTPDRVNVLVDLAPHSAQFLLPAATALSAGSDSLGQDLVYRTDHDIVVNQAQIAELRSIFIDRRVTGIREARELYDGPRNEAIINMLNFALGHPNPGDPMPDYPDGRGIDYELLENFYVLLTFVGTELSMKFDTFRQLMRLRVQRDTTRNKTIEEWTQINAIFERILRTRTDNSREQFAPQNPSDFETDLKQVLEIGDNYDKMFDGITQVKDIYDAFDLRSDQETRDRIRERLYLPIDDKDCITVYHQAPDGRHKFLFRSQNEFSSHLNASQLPQRLRQEFADEQIRLSDQAIVSPVTRTHEWQIEDGSQRYSLKRTVAKTSLPDSLDFTTLMQLKVRIDGEWQEINRILAEAGQKKGTLKPPITFPGANQPNFEANLAYALGSLQFPDDLTNIDDYDAALKRVEQFFLMSAENLVYLLALARKWVNDNVESTSSEWDTVYKILADAHKAKVYAAHSEPLKKAHLARDFEAMAGIALDEDPAAKTVDELITGLTHLVPAAESAYLNQIAPRLEEGKSVTDEEWAELHRIAQIAQRARLGEPVAQKVEWLNLYPAEDATAVEVNLGLDPKAESTRWSTFGQGQLALAPDGPPQASFGWAISSPILALSQGVRTISLTLGFQQSDHFVGDTIRSLFFYPTTSNQTIITASGDGSSSITVEKGAGPFRIELSTEKGWIEPDSLTVSVGDYNDLSSVQKSDQDALLSALKFELTFNEDAEAIGVPAAEEAQVEASWPLLKMILRPIFDAERGRSGAFYTPYQQFDELVLVKTHVEVSVSGLSEFQIENDETVLKSTKPFEPFGNSPTVGSRFYLGHPEIVHKRLNSLDLHIEWMGAPQDMQEYYSKSYADVGSTTGSESYTAPVTFTESVTNQTFSVRMGLIDRRVDVPLAENLPLFVSSPGARPTANNGSTPVTRTLTNIPAALQAGRRGYIYRRAPDAVIDEDLRRWSRYWVWELNTPDFQHTAFPTVVAKKSLALAAAISNIDGVPGIVAEDYQVNPPYTPKIKSLSLDYSSAVEIRMDSYSPDSQVDRIYHVQPFGSSEIQPEASEDKTTTKNQHFLFLPQYDNEGELYIGIRGAQPAQNLSVLFQMADGSADPDLDPAPIAWSYLSGNRWLNLDKGKLLQDDTRGLINSGIVSFALDPVLPSTLLPADLYWIRAAVSGDGNSVCDTVAIHTQAVSATLEGDDYAPDHLSRPLPAETIADLANPLPEISGIRQPYTSYGGKMPEQDSTFYTRISERIRHKHRAVTLWDYEHMILERFPQIYKAKCLPADARNPGQVEIIVIPDIMNKLPFNPFEPKAPSNLIADIESYLADTIPAFAEVKVRNAHYVPVKVRFAVRFQPGYNEGFYKQQLNEEINRFLSPWAYEESAEIVIGGRIYANVIINFIEERPYVDFVAEVKLFSSEDGLDFHMARQSADESGYWVETSRPDGVLVAAREQIIYTISDVGYEAEDFTGINYMKLQLDFIVG